MKDENSIGSQPLYGEQIHNRFYNKSEERRIQSSTMSSISAKAKSQNREESIIHANELIKENLRKHQGKYILSIWVH